MTVKKHTSLFCCSASGKLKKVYNTDARSLKEDISVRDTDFSCFKYYDKSQQKATLDKPYAQVKALAKSSHQVSLEWLGQ